MEQFRQGDVLLTKLEAAPREIQGMIEPSRAVDRLVLAFGEVTGHAHAIYPEVEVIDGVEVKKDVPAKIWDAGAERFLQVIEKTALKHEEHGAIDLEPGFYRISQQREYDPQLHSRVVAD